MICKWEIQGCGCNGGQPKIAVCLKFLRQELLYDIKNIAYIEGHVHGEENQHAQHTLVDIGEEGNVDRVTRVLSLAHAGAVEALYPLTKTRPQEEVINDMLREPNAYYIDMLVPVNMSKTTMEWLEHLIHELMVDLVLYDWLGITNPQAAEKWKLKADAVKEEIEKAKSNRWGTFTRKSNPF